MVLVLTRDETLHILQEKRDYLHAEFGVSRIGVFGSIATGRSDDSSDVDIVVEFDRPIGFRFVELADYLESLTGRKVDLLTRAGIQAIRSPKVADDISAGVIYV